MGEPTGAPSDERAGGSPDEYTCEACGRTFESADALDRHVRDVGLVD